MTQDDVSTPLRDDTQHLSQPQPQPQPQQLQDPNYEQAAHAVWTADVLVLITGAGFSADSGLAVYNDVADIPAYQIRLLTYMDVCQPHWLEEDPQLFYGFWGQCFNDYRTTQPHEGYSILAKWRNDRNAKNATKIATDLQRRIQHKIHVR